ncbi:MAG: hypothetical protein V1930_07940 [Pseudomonadota bacterium]
MKNPKWKRKPRKLTLSSLVGLIMGTCLTLMGLYYAIAHASAGAYFVIFLGLIFNGVIIWIHRG